MPSHEEMITAQVVLFSPEGKSILDTQQLSGSNLEGRIPNEELVQRALKELNHLGFKCTPLYPTLTIQGPRSLFEKTFALRFKHASLAGISYSKPEGKVKLPHSLKNLVADVVFGEPMEPFV